MSTAIQMIFEDITGGDVRVPESALGASKEDTESEKEAAAQASLAARAAARAAAISAFAGPDSEDSRGCEKERDIDNDGDDGDDGDDDDDDYKPTQHVKRQKSISYRDDGDEGVGVRQRAHPDGSRAYAATKTDEAQKTSQALARKLSFSMQRGKSSAQQAAHATIEAVSADRAAGPTLYAGYSVTKTVAEESRFTFFWLHKSCRKAKPLMVSIGVDKRKSGHFIYQRAPGLPDSVPPLECTSRPQVLAWILTHFSVRNVQVGPQLRKALPVISAKDAYLMADLPLPEDFSLTRRSLRDRVGPKVSEGAPEASKTAKAAKQLAGVRDGTSAKPTTKQSAKQSPKPVQRRPSRNDTEWTETPGMMGWTDVPEGTDFDIEPGSISGLPSPLEIPSPRLANMLDIPSPSDLLPTSPASGMMPTPATNPASFDDFKTPSVPSVEPSRSSEEPEMEIIDVFQVRCGACGLNDHQTPNCPFQQGVAVSITTKDVIPPPGIGEAAKNGTNDTNNGANDTPPTPTAQVVARGTTTIDTTFAIMSDMLHSIGCWSEVNSPEEVDTLSGLLDPPSAAGAQGVQTVRCVLQLALFTFVLVSPISLTIQSLISCVFNRSASEVLRDPNSDVKDIEWALRRLEQSSPSLEELTGSGVVNRVAHLLVTSPEKSVTDASRVLCLKWRTQAEQAMLDLV